MQNPQLVGLGRADHFNLRGSMGVIAAFGIITIISYFNELNKAGLLRRGVVPGPLPHSATSKRSERAVDHHTLIEKDGDLHNLGLHILKIKQDVKRKKQKGHQEINIKLHLGQNSSYVTGSNSTLPMYNHKNTLPNFYSTMNLSQYNSSAFNLTVDKVLSWSNASGKAKLEKLRHKYQKSVLVFTYQHDSQLHHLSECLRNISLERGLAINNMPINRRTRKQWDSMGRAKRNSFNVLYGSRAFGICESVAHPCGYVTLVSHPVDRFIALYDQCRPPISSSVRNLCRQNGVDIKNLTLAQFALAKGSSLFENLVDYAKHCRLIGDDELCVQGARTTFVLTPGETAAHLKHILGHLDSWFSAVGLVDRLHQSLDLLQNIYGLPFSNCLGKFGLGTGDDTPIGLHMRRKQLLNNPEVQRALHADLQIYKKLSYIFNAQLTNRRLVQGLIKESKAVRIMKRKAEKKEKLKAIKASKLKDKIAKLNHIKEGKHKDWGKLNEIQKLNQTVIYHNQTTGGGSQGKFGQIHSSVVKKSKRQHGGHKGKGGNREKAERGKGG